MSARAKQMSLPLFDEPTYQPPPDFLGPVVDKPGGDCGHPGRLCVVNDLDVCPYALTPWMGRNGYHTTRCGRDDEGREMTVEEIAAVFGVSDQVVVNITARALEKLERSRLARRVEREWRDE